MGSRTVSRVHRRTCSDAIRSSDDTDNVNAIDCNTPERESRSAVRPTLLPASAVLSLVPFRPDVALDDGTEVERVTDVEHAGELDCIPP